MLYSSPLTPVAPMLLIRSAQFPHDADLVDAIFREYVASPRANLDFQNYEAEFAALPGPYAAPRGCLLLAWLDDKVMGCAALRQVNSTDCELKRVYVRPAARGKQTGRKLVLLMLGEARRRGYTRMYLDVLPEFTAAQQLYESLGFVDGEAISHNPVPGTRFMVLDL